MSSSARPPAPNRGAPVPGTERAWDVEHARVRLPEAPGPATAHWPERSCLRSFTTRVVERVWLGDVDGLHHVPGGAHVLVANHASFLDFFVLATVYELRLARSLRFWAGKKMMRHPVFRHFCRAAGCLEVSPGDFQRRLWRASLEYLASERGALCIFPEGTRTRTGRAADFKLGYLRLAAEAGVPVVPARLENAYRVWAPGRRLPRLERIDVRLHAARPVEPEPSGADLRARNGEVRELCVA